MRLENHFSDKPLYTPHPCTRCVAGAADPAPLLLTEEHLLTLFVDGVPTHTFVCSPAQLSELCIGWMISEGVLSGLEDLDSLIISEDGWKADAQTVADGSELLRPFPACQSPDPDRIARAMECLYGADTVHARTHGTHGCVLSAGDGSMTLFEDIGRYNAADKAIGAAVLRGCSMEQCMLLSSGRVPEGMVQKMVRSRIPVLVSKAVATVSAVEAARSYNLTLCFSARDHAFSCPSDQTALSGGADAK